MATALSQSGSFFSNDGYMCDCGRSCRSQRDLDQHKLENCKRNLFKCSFCGEGQSSTKSLHDHLMTCGNRTDQCPNCRKFIRRAIFAYHFENNCANLDDADLSGPSINSSTKENSYTDKNILSNYQTKSFERMSSSTSNTRNSLNTIRCEFCSNTCESSEYEAHKKNCLSNPNKSSKSTRQRSSILDQSEVSQSTKTDAFSKEIDSIPCEYCNQLIHFDLFLNHTKSCQEKENRRLETRAKEINEQRINEKLPCEHCTELFSVDLLEIHQRLCKKNPEYIALMTRIGNQSSLGRVPRLNDSSRINTNPIISSGYSSLPFTSRSAYNLPLRSEDILDQSSDREDTHLSDQKTFKSYLTLNVGSTKNITQSSDYDPSSVNIRPRSSSNQRPMSAYGDSRLTNSSYGTSGIQSMAFSSNDFDPTDTRSLRPKSHRGTSADRLLSDRISENYSRPMPKPRETTNTRTLDTLSGKRSLFDSRGSHHFHDRQVNDPLRTFDDKSSFDFHQEDRQYRPFIGQSSNTVTNRSRFDLNSAYNMRPLWKS